MKVRVPVIPWSTIMYKGWATKISPCTATFEDLLCLVHNHSFHNMDCARYLQNAFADKKFSCSRTKCANQSSPLFWALEELKNGIKCVNFVTMSCEISYHKHVKQLPILLRYFRTYYKPEGSGFDSR
jgi:hypothetical protein